MKTLSKADLRQLAAQIYLTTSVPVQTIPQGRRAYTPSEMRKAEFGMKPTKKPEPKQSA